MGIINSFVKAKPVTKLSFLIFGLANICYKQIIKGILFLIAQIAFIAFFSFYGVDMLRGFITLGTKQQEIVIDPITQLPVTVSGDNSMRLLLSGVILIILVAAFILLWVTAVNSALNAEKHVQAGKKNASFSEDIKSLLDKDIHKSMLLLPMLGLVLVTIIPLLYMIFIAFTNYDQYHQPPGKLFDWVWFKNFIDLFNAGGSLGNTFLQILLWTIIWACFATFTCYFGGILLAILINQKKIRGKAIWRTIFVLTVAIPNFVTLLIAKSMLQTQGVVNVLLQNTGFTTGPLPFFTNTYWARITLIVVNRWVGIPVTMLFASGVLQNIPSELYESAKIDGANPFVTFTRITMPFVLFMTAPVLISNFVGNINNFNVIFFLSGGEPLTVSYFGGAGKTDLLVTWLYKLTMKSNDYSYASAVGILIFIISAGLSLLFYRKSKSFKNEGEFQ